jgi:hypothetical protein
VFGEQAVRDLARDARSNLIERLERLLHEDRERFELLLGDVGGSGDPLRARASELEQVAR